ncbi:sensor histidine kinase [Rhodococcus sp. KBS0724]|uniref:sensor histidine kinase n=1 Tax=Rhodococcus sp. KBS0724 TaxID=1179674 RepID=UPI00163DA9FB|nr:histidine kinase [Rhodococcus sp. KBS0724]
MSLLDFEHLIRRPWFRQASTLDRIALVVSILAVCTEAYRMVVEAAPLGGYVAIAVTALGVAISRRYSWAGLIVVLAGSVIDAVFWDPLVPWTVAVFTVFSLTLRGTSGLGAGLAAGSVAYAASVYANSAGFFDAAAIAGFASAIAAAAAGNAVRNRDRYWKALEERALDAIAARESETNRRVAEERVRIARDLHDMVGHEIAVVNMNLGVAEVNLPPDSQRSRDALDAARAGVTAVLRETQSILQVLRGGSSAVEDQTQPVPGVDQISGLIDSYRRIGLKVNAEIDTVVDKLDPTVDTAIYRIVQEALTNAHRHGNSDVDLAIKSAAGFIVAAVTNRRSSTGSRNLPGEGYGLVGMRERATSAGGVLDIGGDETMFTVTATVPIHGRSIR